MCSPWMRSCFFLLKTQAQAGRPFPGVRRYFSTGKKTWWVEISQVITGNGEVITDYGDRNSADMLITCILVPGPGHPTFRFE